MTRGYGWAKKEDRCACKVPHGHWHTNTFIAALRLDGIYAPWLLDGPMDGQCFQVYIEKVLVPTLKPGDQVICDNLACHRSEAVRDILASCGAEIIYLPAYSPDLNPIEMVFSKLKSLMKKESPRNLEDIIQSVSKILPKFSALECSRYFRHAQYATN